jgi:hypothetical protein
MAGDERKFIIAREIRPARRGRPVVLDLISPLHALREGEQCCTHILDVLLLFSRISFVVIGLTIASADDLASYQAALARYARWAKSSGQVIDRGIYTILFAIALGILTEISRSIRKT